MKLSKQAEAILLAAPGKVGGKTSTTGGELLEQKLITGNGNLTVKGYVERDKIARRKEDEAFG
jgi:hypothetical protein